MVRVRVDRTFDHFNFKINITKIASDVLYFSSMCVFDTRPSTRQFSHGFVHCVHERLQGRSSLLQHSFKHSSGCSIQDFSLAIQSWIRTLCA